MTQTMQNAKVYYLPFPGGYLMKVDAPVSAQDIEQFARRQVEILRKMMKGTRGRNRATYERDIKHYLRLAEDAPAFSKWFHESALKGKKLEVMF